VETATCEKRKCQRKRVTGNPCGAKEEGNPCKPIKGMTTGGGKKYSSSLRHCAALAKKRDKASRVFSALRTGTKRLEEE